MLHNAAGLLFLIKDAGVHPGQLRMVGFKGKAQAHGTVGPGSNISAPMGHCGFFRGSEPDVAVDAAAGVPAGAFALVVQLDFNGVGACLQPGVQFHGPGGIAIRPAAGFFPVHIHLGVGKSAIHFQAKVFVQIVHREGFAIGGLPPPGQFAGLSGVLLLEGLLYAPVVRKVQDAAFSVLGEGPAVVPQLASGGLGSGAQGKAQKGGYEEKLFHRL